MDQIWSVTFSAIAGVVRKAFMNAAEIVMGRVKRKRRDVVFEFLAVGIR